MDSLLGQVEGLTVTAYNFKDSLESDMRKADLVISHCGAGTTLEILRMHKKAVGVINDKLMDNHQVELADAMAERRLMAVARSPEDLIDVITNTDWDSLKKVDAPNPSAFSQEICSLLSI